MEETNSNLAPVVAVSACLLGHACRFDGRSKPSAQVQSLSQHFRLLPICPEVAGGLPVPHPPCEIVDGSRPVRVVDESGRDVTREFHAGAAHCLEQLRDADCRVAVLKAKSPSCGSGRVYDGTFSGTLVPGWGVAAQLLRDAGVAVFDETQVASLLAGKQAAESAAVSGDRPADGL